MPLTKGNHRTSTVREGIRFNIFSAIFKVRVSIQSKHLIPCQDFPLFFCLLYFKLFSRRWMKEISMSVAFYDSHNLGHNYSALLNMLVWLMYSYSSPMKYLQCCLPWDKESINYRYSIIYKGLQMLWLFKLLFVKMWKPSQLTVNIGFPNPAFPNKLRFNVGFPNLVLPSKPRFNIVMNSINFRGIYRTISIFKPHWKIPL